MKGEQTTNGASRTRFNWCPSVSPRPKLPRCNTFAQPVHHAMSGVDVHDGRQGSGSRKIWWTHHDVM